MAEGLEREVLRRLASSDEHGRVIHIGTFSKTMGPALRLGFVVVPPALEQAATRLAGILAPAPPPIIQHAMAAFIRDGHYLRHLRRMKTRYSRAASLLLALVSASGWSCRLAGLSLLFDLPPETDDVALARAARALRLAPSALSSWFEHSSSGPRGLLLSVTNIDEANAADSWNRLFPLLPNPP